MESYFWANDRCTSRSKSVILSLSTHDNLVFDLGRAAAQAIARLFSLGSLFFSFSFARLFAGY